MRIQNNISAMNTQRQLAINQSSQSKSSEKLSSGYRVNRAADDAAGLAISEKMRAQIRGLNRASSNAQDAISMIQAAEGALIESHSILQRIRELAIQGANDVNADDDRIAIKSEIDQLGLELDRIATTTNFNGKYILSGKYLSPDYWPDGYTNIPDEMETLGVTEPAGALNIQIGANTKLSDVVQIRFRGVTASDLLNGHLDKNGEMSDVNWTEYDPQNPLDSGFTPNVFYKDESGGLAKVTDPETKAPTHYGFRALIDAIDSSCPYYHESYKDASVDPRNGEYEHLTGLKLISAMRGELGALQNRLEHTIANVDTIGENMQAAESRIRDVDMAKEVMRFAKDDILNKSANAMMAQANQMAQSILSLLR
ncbi:flagellin [Clostridia bacterium]|nr:flagellin [Clostridia bacterium]GHV35551.1 flagellin [Clostridia bacterium]